MAYVTKNKMMNLSTGAHSCVVLWCQLSPQTNESLTLKRSIVKKYGFYFVFLTHLEVEVSCADLHCLLAPPKAVLKVHLSDFIMAE